MTKLDIKQVMEQAEREVREEQTKRAVILLKEKKGQIAKATTILENLRREEQELVARIGEGNF